MKTEIGDNTFCKEKINRIIVGELSKHKTESFFGFGVCFVLFFFLL